MCQWLIFRVCIQTRWRRTGSCTPCCNTESKQQLTGRGLFINDVTIVKWFQTVLIWRSERRINNEFKLSTKIIFCCLLLCFVLIVQEPEKFPYHKLDLSRTRIRTSRLWFVRIIGNGRTRNRCFIEATTSGRRRRCRACQISHGLKKKRILYFFQKQKSI